MSKDRARKSCGLVMPISSIDGCPAEHWIEVKSIVEEALEASSQYDFDVKLVSDADEVGVIQKRIVQNLYQSDIVVCDVSGKNPNVMFELGMRLAFDKPTVIIKDDKTEYSFDTGVIEHVGYRRDLRFSDTVAFKEKLAKKVSATLSTAENNSEHSTFLKNFGAFQVASIQTTEVSSDALVLETLSEIQGELALLRSRMPPRQAIPSRPPLKHRIRMGIRAWQRREDTESDPAALIGDEDFYSFMVERIDAPLYCESRQEFISLVNETLHQMAA